jgi:4-amino-4-deoxy-L-arabinose transferase-like glycosyltransferase
MASAKFRWVVPTLVMITTAGYFITADPGIGSAPRFEDEAAILGQTYFFRLVMERDFANPDWLSHAAYDHQPLYKYLIGASLYLTGQQEAVPRSLADWRKWMYSGTYQPREGPALKTARITMALGAGFACAAAFCVGRAFGGTWAGLLAAGLFVSSPLVFVYARRAMIDVTAQGLAMATLAAFAGLMQRRGITFLCWMIIVGLLAGLAGLAKWNAAVAAAGCLMLGIIGIFFGSNRTRLLGFLGSLGVSLAAVVFIAGDPFLWSKPVFTEPKTVASSEFLKLQKSGVLGRIQHALDYRRASLQRASQQFPNDFLASAERLPALVIQGLGRWSLGNRLYSTDEANLPRIQRTRWEDHLRAWVLGIFVVAGLWSTVAHGLRQRKAGEVPTFWLIPLWLILDAVLLQQNLTLDWDRYYLSTVAQGSVVSSLGLAAWARGFVNAMKLPVTNLQEI